MSENGFVLSVGGVKRKGSIFLEQAQRRGFKVWVVDTAENIGQAPDVVKRAERVSPLSYTDPEACVQWAQTQARSENLLGVFALSEYSIEAATAMAHALGLPGNHPQVIHTIRNKHLCRQVLREHGFRQPASTLCTTLAEAQHFTQAHLPGPWIIKPPSEGGSIGVSLVREEADWEPALRHLGYPLPAPFVVECFQSGTEFSAEGAFVSGIPQVLALTSKITTQAPHFIEIGHTMPADLPGEITQRARETVSAALLATGMRWGVFHVEFWLDQEQIVLGELHARSGGDNLHPMTELVTGLDLYGVVLDQLAQNVLDPASWDLYQRGAAMRYLVAPPGRVTAISGLAEVSADPVCVQAKLALRVGDESKPMTSSLDRHGFVLATGETAGEAGENAERLCRQIQVEVEPLAVGSSQAKH